ncbi:HNH endonuclease signature motif containing protein [Kribbella pratensis]|nr:HNH endonuclease signature motif containing protein [Kribbella pratensis]
MELLGERPAWSMSGAEVLSTLDRLDADLARRETYRLQLIARMDVLEHAQEIGAHNTAQLLEFRYRLDRSRALRDVRLARSLAKYDAVSAALPDPHADPDSADADVDEPAEVVLRPAQAEAIVSALNQVPSKVPADDVAVAERELIGLARYLSPSELRGAGQRIRDFLDTDGPEPEEHKAFARETLTLTTADRGVKFRGYLANENAELLRSLIHAGARPHKTLDGEPDPRSREKRQADALTTTLTIAATALDAGTPTPRTPRPTHTPSPSADRHHTPRTPGAPSTSDMPGAPGLVSTDIGTCTSGRTDMNDANRTGGRTDTGDANRPSGSTHTSEANPTSGTTHTSDASRASGRTDTSDPNRLSTGASTRDVGVATLDGAGVGRGSDGGGEVPGFGAKANITVTIDLQDLKSAAADAIGDTVYGDGLSAAAIRRLACDAKVIPLVLGTNSEPLDVGRSERLVTRAMRRALNTRDRGCVVCGAPPIQCDAHHLISWIDGGETKISNLALLCRRHHIDLHAGDWTITITNGKVHVSRPTWADPPPHQRPTPTPLNAPAQPHAARRSTTPTDDPSANTSPHHDPANQNHSHPTSTDQSPTKPAPRDSTPPEASPDHMPTGQETNDRLLGEQPSTERSVARAAVASVIRRSALGRELLQRGQSAKQSSTGESSVDEGSTASFREAAYQAIWGETTTPPIDRLTAPAQIPIRDPQSDAPPESGVDPARSRQPIP